MHIRFTRIQTESVDLDAKTLLEIIPNIRELDDEEIEKQLICYFWNKDLEETIGLSEWGETHKFIKIEE